MVQRPGKIRKILNRDHQLDLCCVVRSHDRMHDLAGCQQVRAEYFCTLDRRSIQNDHVEINIIASLLKNLEHEKKYALARLSDIARYVILTVLAIFLTYLWIEFTLKAMKLGQTSAALMIPMTTPYIIIDIGMISVIIHSLFRLIISIDPQVLKGGEESCI